MLNKLTNRSFGFEYEGAFIQGTLLLTPNNQRNYHLFVGDQEFESAAAWKTTPEEQIKLDAAIVAVINKTP